MIEKKVHLTEDILKSVLYRTKMEDVDESTAIRQFIRLGVMWYVVELYKRGKITLGEAAELSGVSLRRMLAILAEHGVKGNVKMKQQIRALDYAKNLGDEKVVRRS
jgi:predicted HTH domain antitoxin